MEPKLIMRLKPRGAVWCEPEGTDLCYCKLALWVTCKTEVSSMLFWHGNDSEFMGEQSWVCKGIPPFYPKWFFFCFFCFGFCYCEQKKGIGQEYKKAHSSRKTTDNILMYIFPDPSLSLSVFLFTELEPDSVIHFSYFLYWFSQKIVKTWLPCAWSCPRHWGYVDEQNKSLTLVEQTV